MAQKANERVGKMFVDDLEAIAFCLADWPEGEEHWTWLVNAEEKEIRDWVDAAQDRRE